MPRLHPETLAVQRVLRAIRDLSWGAKLRVLDFARNLAADEVGTGGTPSEPPDDLGIGQQGLFPARDAVGQAALRGTAPEFP
jgi:hypothetical protein